MYEKFGEFDSWEEINRAAAAQLTEGDTQAIYDIAEENGIDRMDAEDYINGDVDELCNAYLAAVGKIDIEVAHYKLEGHLKDYAEELKVFAQDENIALGIRKKGFSFAQYLAKLIDSSYEKRVTVPKEIVKLTKTVKGVMGSHDLTEGGTDKAQRFNIAVEYFVEGQK